MNTDMITRYERGDACYGTVGSRCRSGAFLELDNGELAFARGAGNLRKNTKVICTVKKPASNGYRTLVQLDSVCGLYEVA